MPDWLRNLRSTATANENEPPPAEQESESAPLPEGEVPDWLARLRTAPPEPEETPTAGSTTPAPGVSEEAPDWIKRLEQQGQADAVADANIPTKAPAEPGESVPMENAPLETEGSESEQTAPSTGIELPSWIEQLPTDEEAAEANPLETESSEEGGTAFAGEPTPIAGEPTEGLSIPELDKLAPSPSAGQSVDEEIPIASADEFAAQLGGSQAGTEPSELADEDIPDWLRTPAPAGTSAAVTAPGAPAEETAGSVSEEPVIPAWARKQPPTAEAATGQPGAAQEQPGAESALEPARAEELPGWLAALKPEGTDLGAEAGAPVETGMGMPPQIEAEPAEARGPLAGLRGVLPLAVAVSEPHLSTKAAKPAAEKTSVAHIFDTILAEPVVEPAPSAAAVKRRRLGFRPWIYLLIALAVIVPFLLPTGLASSLLSISNTPAAEFYDTLQAVPSGSTVLISFDYDPSMTGEMDLAANAIARDLVQRKVRIIAVSTLETGPQIAQNVLDRAASGNSFRYGTDYLNLGYLPGHEAGLAQLATTGLPVNNRDLNQSRPLDQFTAFAGIRRLQDVQLVVELAGTEDALKMWMEQVQPRAGVRIAAGVSAGVEPKARAYLDAHQLAAMTSGLVGAARYEILSNRPGLAVTSINAQSAAMIVLVLLVVLGNIVFWVSRARGRPPQ